MYKDKNDVHLLSHDTQQSSSDMFSLSSESDDAKQSNQNVHCLDVKTEKSVAHENNVAVILGYYDGDAYIAEQLHSIFAQSHKAFHVFISDDQSPTPFNIDTLGLDADQLAKLSIGIRSKNIGFAKNYLKVLADLDRSFEYFAFSDQDDIWQEDKLEKALVVLSEVSSDVPALYCSRTEIVDETCTRTLGYSPLFSKPPSFANALVQNIGGGNTMVFNKAACDLIVSSLNTSIVSHDWWCYLIVTGAGGYLFYDPEPCIKYRQHGNNLVGAHMSWAARIVRILRLMQGRFRKRNDINLKALSNHKHLLTEQNIRVLNDFMDARQSRLLKRIKLFKRSGIYCQTLFGNLGLLLGILLNRI